MTILALCLLLVAAAAVIAAQARIIHESDDLIAALNAALEEAHTKVLEHRDSLKTYQKVDDLELH